MRLDTSAIIFFKQAIEEKIPGAKVYLFGSRTNNLMPLNYDTQQ